MNEGSQKNDDYDDDDDDDNCFTSVIYRSLDRFLAAQNADSSVEWQTEAEAEAERACFCLFSELKLR